MLNNLQHDHAFPMQVICIKTYTSYFDFLYPDNLLICILIKILY